MRSNRRVRTVVVDDHADARELIGLALTRSGHFEVVGEATDGAEAVTVAADCRPDLVLLDLNMPGTDGLTALPQVQAVCAPHTVVVVMSVEHSAQTSEDVVRAGAAAFLPKDPGFRRLVDDLLALLGDAIPAADAQAVHWHLPADLASGARARQQLRDLLTTWQLANLLDEVELLATELINNAVVHADSDVLLSVSLRQDALRVEVTDVGDGTPHRPTPDLHATHGRGLMLVEAMSTAWGTAANGEAKTVWFELATND